MSNKQKRIVIDEFWLTYISKNADVNTIMHDPQLAHLSFAQRMTLAYVRSVERVFAEYEIEPNFEVVIQKGGKSEL